jgi:ubiquinone/menaquinone biosynthesis C-methylase UbiE
MDITHYKNSEYAYSERFWGKTENREYEHEADQLAIKNACKDNVSWIVDLGGGFGRLVPTLKTRSEHVIIVDASMDLLEEAQATYGADETVQYIRANVYKLPFRDVSISTSVCMRVMHHITEPDIFFRELNRVMAGTIYLEFPNKRHFVQWIRFLFKNDHSIDVFSSRPEMRNTLFLNFTLQFVRSRLLKNTVFAIDRVAGLSFIRQEKIKKVVPLRILLGIENFLQHVPFIATFAPSVLLTLSKKAPRTENSSADITTILACPVCHDRLEIESTLIRCTQGHTYSTKGRILDLYAE